MRAIDRENCENILVMKRQQKLNEFFQKPKSTIIGPSESVIIISDDDDNCVMVAHNKPDALASSSVLKDVGDPPKSLGIGVFRCSPSKQTKRMPSATSAAESSSIVSATVRSTSSATSESENTRSMNIGDKPKRKCPFYKRIPGTSFVMDAFSYGVIDGVNAYFLSHFHYDHYQGLKKTFNQTIYCNEITANLVKLKLKVSDKCIHILPMEVEVFIGNISVKLFDANHCPGSAVFLFILPNGKRIVHTGDFRASDDLSLWKGLENVRGKIDVLFLDSTYLNPQYEFPPQSDVISCALSIALEAVNRYGNKVLFVCGTYTIGKERLFLKLAECLDMKVGVDKPKFDILKCFHWSTIDDYVTRDFKDSGIHVRPMADIKIEKMQQYLLKFPAFSHLVAFCPTGWNYSSNFSISNAKPAAEAENISIYNLPYSEHSCFSELRTFVKFLKPKKVITTVGSNYEQMMSYIDSWV